MGLTRINEQRDLKLGKSDGKRKRSSKWESVRKNFLLTNPCCAVCGGKDKLNVHHLKPFHTNPELELDPNNLITLCESGKKGVNCHLFVGHLGDYKKINKECTKDAKTWSAKLSSKN
jgi:5-methylcytosine-specific restriction protein A